MESTHQIDDSLSETLQNPFEITKPVSLLNNECFVTLASCQKISQSKGQRPRRLEKSEQILHDANFIPNLTKFLYCDVSTSKPRVSVLLWFSDGFSRRCNCDGNRWVGFYLSGKSCFPVSYKVNFISHLLIYL